MPRRPKTASSPVCVIAPPGLQTLLFAVSLIRTMATCRAVLVCTEREHLSVLPRLFRGVKLTFWFDVEDAAERARSHGMDVLELPADPKEMYGAAHMPVATMHSDFCIQRDTPKEDALVEHVKNTFGQTYVLMWSEGAIRPLQRRLMPLGVPVVDAATLDVSNPLDYCGVMEQALQVHATDTWFLTLADLVGGQSRKYCHAYAGVSSALACRKKYRRRVNIFCQPRDKPGQSPVLDRAQHQLIC